VYLPDFDETNPTTNNLFTAVAISLPDDDDSDDMEQTSFPFPHCMRSSLQGSDPNPAQTHSTPLKWIPPGMY